jgi:hypothetical protein
VYAGCAISAEKVHADLRTVNEAWADLPEAVKAGIVAMVKAASSNLTFQRYLQQHGCIVQIEANHDINLRWQPSFRNRARHPLHRTVTGALPVRPSTVLGPCS